jgi:predicted permease
MLILGILSFFFMIIFAVGLLFGFIVRKIAKKNGRAPRMAFWLGFFFTFFALIGYLIAGETEEKKVARIKNAMQS